MKATPALSWVPGGKWIRVDGAKQSTASSSLFLSLLSFTGNERPWSGGCRGGALGSGLHGGVPSQRLWDRLVKKERARERDAHNQN